jgi:hypothetical protein
MNRGGFIAGDLMGRTAFGVFAVILDACAVMMWIDLAGECSDRMLQEGPQRSEHDPEKQVPVSQKDHAQTKR